MGQRLVNSSIVCDYATPENDTYFELHMALPIPYQDLSIVQNWLSQNDWQSTERYLSHQYPQHKALLAQWCASSKMRKEGRAVAIKDSYIAVANTPSKKYPRQKAAPSTTHTHPIHAPLISAEFNNSHSVCQA